MTTMQSCEYCFEFPFLLDIVNENDRQMMYINN